MPEIISELGSRLKQSSESAIVSQSLYRLDLSYIGEKYYGFQSQPNGNTIQDYLETALATFCRHPVRVTSASRTDTGVHAEHQVVTFKGAAGLNVFRIAKALNSLLAPDIRIMNVQVCPDSFHPTYNSTGKAYRYRIWKVAGENPFVSPFAWRMYHPVDLVLMKDAARQFIGTHDFTSLCAADSSAKSKIRRVREIEIFDRGPMLEIWVLGDGFLKQMVRNMVGLLVALGRGKVDKGDIKVILEGKDRRLAPATAPACGLCLVKVFYGDDLPVSTLVENSNCGYNLSLGGPWI
jgi:tRNA pseudouridine38-40 synthase